ncbi:hypothetical protein BDB01DRAFT_843766 [Pilobolus umbonatus]|nr:hypothetical protein BDB01DRAFT_843766 [Pilobolus umbonatus]
MLPRLKNLALDTTTLSSFSRRLINCPRLKVRYQPDVKEAAVLMPLCTIDGKPSVLFTVRNMNMRSHQGEISQVDPEDPSLEYTALREMSEEVGIDPSSIDILGCYSTLPNKTGSLRVHPYVGYIKDPHIDMSKYNPDEVSSVFTLPLEYLIRPDIREIKQFRDSVLRKIIPEHYK